MNHKFMALHHLLLTQLMSIQLKNSANSLPFLPLWPHIHVSLSYFTNSLFRILRNCKYLLSEYILQNSLLFISCKTVFLLQVSLSLSLSL
jgi:hypothetical protein